MTDVEFFIVCTGLTDFGMEIDEIITVSNID